MSCQLHWITSKVCICWYSFSWISTHLPLTLTNVKSVFISYDGASKDNVIAPHCQLVNICLPLGYSSPFFFCLSYYISQLKSQWGQSCSYVFYIYFIIIRQSDRVLQKQTFIYTVKKVGLKNIADMSAVFVCEMRCFITCAVFIRVERSESLKKLFCSFTLKLITSTFYLLHYHHLI